MDPIVIIGSGLAGFTLAREFRKLDASTPLVLVTADSGDFYSKPMLSNAFAQGKSTPQLVNTPAARMAEQLGIALAAHTRAERIRPQEREIDTSGGAQRYRKLVIAIGADPIRLPLGGNAAAEVLSVNDLADYAVFRQRLAGRKKVAIIGAGLIGCEFANDLAGAGFAVTVIDPSPHPLASLLPPEAGRELVKPLARIGVTWQFGTSVEAVDHQADGYRITLKNGVTFESDIVLSAVGLRPRTALAQEAGLAVNRGIVADKALRTSDEHVYALGDCAEIDGQTRPFVMPIMYAAKALAQTLAGQPTDVVFPPMPVAVKTPACPVLIQPAGRGAEGQWQALERNGGIKMVFADSRRRITGFVLTGGKIGERAAMARLLAT
jgi:rubredoxin-NAD+ reductase